MDHRSPATRVLRIGVTGALLGVCVAIGVAGCTQGASPGSSGSSAGTLDASRQADAAGSAAAPAPESATSGDGAAARVTDAGTLLGRDVIRHATMTVRTRHVGTALAEVRTTVGAAGGVVADERTRTSRDGRPTTSVLTLRVPADAFTDVLGDLAGLGRVVAQRVDSEDVSTQVVDVDARIASAERTLDRLRDLVGQADDLGDVLSLESELARREAELASLKAQQRYLDDQTALSTVDLTLRRPAAAAAADDEPAGFVAGMALGWDALSGVTATVLTALGVLVPLLVLLVPAGALLYWGTRRLGRMGRRAAAQPPA